MVIVNDTRDVGMKSMYFLDASFSYLWAGGDKDLRISPFLDGRTILPSFSNRTERKGNGHSGAITSYSLQGVWS